MVSASDDKLTLISKEGTEHKVNPEITNMSIFLSNVLEDCDGDYSEAIPLG